MYARCVKCDTNVPVGSDRCQDRKACGRRAAAMTGNQKAKINGMTQQQYRDRQANRAWHLAHGTNDTNGDY
jgi:hypothetical protein